MLRIFRHYIPTSIVWLIIIEFIILYGSVYLGVELRFIGGDSGGKLLLEPLAPKALLFAAAMWLAMTAMGLHTRNVVDDFASLMIRIVLSFGLGFLGSILFFYIYPELLLGRGVLAFAMLTAFFGILISRTIYQRIDKHRIFRRRILVLGTGAKAKILEGINDAAQKRGQEIVGYVSIDVKKPKVTEESILKVKTTLLELAEENDIDEIVLAMDDRRQGFPINGLLECKMRGIFVRDLVHFLERIRGHIELEVLHPSVVIFSSGFTKAVSPGGGKRLFDIMASLMLLIVASPVIVLTYIIIWFSSLGRDPVFYRQVRIGLSNRPFGVLKFRSMKVDAEKDGAQFAKKKDPRVTFVGAFIRKTRIDELPQLINVLRGDMSFVGPRPERPEFVEQLIEEIPYYNGRHRVKPGLTGWAQLCYQYGSTSDDARNKLEFDLYYVKNSSFFLDLIVLLETVEVVLWGKGAQ